MRHQVPVRDGVAVGCHLTIDELVIERLLLFRAESAYQAGDLRLRHAPKQPFRCVPDERGNGVVTTTFGTLDHQVPNYTLNLSGKQHEDVLR